MAITKLSVSTVKNGLLKSNKIWDQTSTWVAAPTNSYFPIASYTVTTAQSSITLAGIPQTFSHLQIRGILNGTAAGTYNSVKMRLNGDSGANYSYHLMYGEGSTSGVQAAASSTSIVGLIYVSQASTSSYVGTGIIDILDYANTNKYKTAKSINGIDLNGSGAFEFGSGAWFNTNAITSVEFSTQSGNFNVGSTLAIYGVN